MNVLRELKSRFRPVLEELAGESSGLLEMIRPAQDARFGDYQANCAMPLGKLLGAAPRAVAARIVQKLDVADLCEPPEIAGPGFINLRIREESLANTLMLALQDARLSVPQVKHARTYVVDYSSPNVAKPMHVGHIRSTVIGDALCRTLRFLGHRVISDNHLGDWGVQFGMIIYGYKHFLDQDAFRKSPVAELCRLYTLVNRLIEYQDAVGDSPQLASWAKQHPAIAEAVLEETAKLHADDAENRRLWTQFLPRCREDIQRLYDRLHIRFDVEYGESFYHEQLGQVVQDFLQRGLARDSEGAVCVFLDGFDVADDHPQERRGLPLRDERSGHDSVPHADLAARRHPVRGGPPAERAFWETVRRGAALGLSGRRAAAHQFWRRAGRGGETLQDPLRGHGRTGGAAR